MAILSSAHTASMVINMPPTALDVDANADASIDANADADADAVSKLVQLALGAIGVGNFSSGSAGAAYRDHLLAGSHGRTYEVAFFVSLGIVYLASVGQMIAAARLVSLDGNSAKKITFISRRLA